MSRRIHVRDVLVLLAASLPALAFTIDPTARDQGVFATIGWRMLHGEVPYASAGMEHKGPLPFVAYALSQLLFGHTIQAARLLAWIAMVVTAWLVVVIARHALPVEKGREAGALAAGVVYALVAGVGGFATWWSGAQAESFMEPFAAGAVLAALGGRGVLAGVLLGVATLGKPLALLLAPALLAAGAHRRPAALVLGIAVPWIATLAVMALRGALPDFIDQVFLVNLDYGRRAMANAIAHPDRFVTSHGLFVPLVLLVPAALGMAGLAGSTSPKRWSVGVRVLALWLVGAYAQVFVQGRFFGYHYLPIVAPLAIAVGAFVVQVTGIKTSSWWRTGLVAVGGFLLVAGLARLEWGGVRVRTDVVRGALSRATFYESLAPVNSDFDVQPAETERVAEWLRANTPADSTVLVWGFEPAVNFLSERRSPTRYLYDWYLTSRTIVPARQARYRATFRREVEASPPSAVVVVHDDTNPVEGRDSAAQLAAIPELAAWLSDNYESVTRIGDFEVYRRVR